MFQPFLLFTHKHLEGLPKLGKRYLVSQSYSRGEDHFGEAKIPLLVTEYADLGQAKIHLNAIKHDKYAAIIDLNNTDHYRKIEDMLAEGSKYRVFWSVFYKTKEVKNRLEHKYKDNMRRYITQHTTWRISKEYGFTPDIQIVFGELFAVLKYGREVRRVKFEEIEKS